jgi:triosephosphate isomerase
MREPVIAGNWKMYKTVFDAVRFISELKDLVSNVKDVQIIVAPPFLAIYPVVQEVKDLNILVSAQDVFWEEEGAYTGEISPKMFWMRGVTM